GMVESAVLHLLRENVCCCSSYFLFFFLPPSPRDTDSFKLQIASKISFLISFIDWYVLVAVSASWADNPDRFSPGLIVLSAVVLVLGLLVRIVKLWLQDVRQRMRLTGPLMVVICLLLFIIFLSFIGLKVSGFTDWSWWCV